MKTMTPIRLLRALAFAALIILACPAAHAAANTKPNVIVLLADQWRADAFGYAGDPNVKTPHFDRLAKESVNFKNAVSGMPVCSPMRASFLTGQRPLTHGIFLNDVQLNTNAVTIAKVLRNAGYDTGAIGKWHVDGRGRSNFIPRERRQGFDYWKVLECTHAYNNSPYYADGPEKLKWEEYDAIAQTKDAEQFIRARKDSGKPFFLYLAWGPPHNPYETAPAKYKAMYKAENIILRANVPDAFKENARTWLAGYYAHCTALDDCLASLRRTLEESGLAENTILLFSSDHGDMIGSQGQIRKQKPYNESAHVPMLFHWPKGLGKKGSVLEAPLNTEDIMPTLLSLCGLPIPKSVEGLDYSGYAKGGKNPGDNSTIVTCASPFGEFERRTGGKEYRALLDTRYTYVRDLNGPWLLFDNQTDPMQMTNLVNLPAHAKLQADLDSRLMKKLKSQGDEFLPGDTYVKKWGYQVSERGTVPYTN